MTQEEYLRIWPLLIYGIACGDLVLNWKPNKQKIYLPRLATAILLLEVLFHNFYTLYGSLEHLSQGYGAFLLEMTRPLLFLAAISYFTPSSSSSEVDTKEHFKENLRIIFILLTLFVIANGYLENDFSIFRFVAIGVLAVVAITKKEWIVYVVLAVRLVVMLKELL